MRGRKPLPKEAKILRGTFRADRAASGVPGLTMLDEAPAPPAGLSAAGRALWRRLAPQLVEHRILSGLDLPAFEMLCSAWEDFLEARTAVYTDARGKPRTLARYMVGRNSQTMPELSAMRSAWSTFRTFCVEFGMTPSSRGRIDVAPARDPAEDPMARILGEE